MKILDGSRDNIISRSLSLIKTFESFRDTVYDDGAGRLTIGYGETNPKVISEYKDTKIPKKVAEQLAVKRIEIILKELEKMVTRDLGDDQVASLVDFVYNLGIETFRHSSLLCVINEKKDFEDVAKWFIRYVYARKEGIPTVFLGLQKRRLCEAKLYTKGSLDLRLYKATQETVNNYVADIKANKLPW